MYLQFVIPHNFISWEPRLLSRLGRGLHYRQFGVQFFAGSSYFSLHSIQIVSGRNQFSGQRVQETFTRGYGVYGMKLSTSV